MLDIEMIEGLDRNVNIVDYEAGTPSVINARDLETPAVFVDGLHGWVFATDYFPGPDPSSDYIGGQIALYRTSDGGKSWQRIASGSSTSQVPVTTDDSYGIPPFAASARMQFVTPSTGWLIGTASHLDTPLLFGMLAVAALLVDVIGLVISRSQVVAPIGKTELGCYCAASWREKLATPPQRVRINLTPTDCRDSFHLVEARRLR